MNGNAINFTKSGNITITLEQDISDDKIFIYVRDTRQGIDPNISQKLFTKFTTKSKSGTGLGLYISKNIVDAHGVRSGLKTTKMEKLQRFLSVFHLLMLYRLAKIVKNVPGVSVSIKYLRKMKVYLRDYRCLRKFDFCAQILIFFRR